VSADEQNLEAQWGQVSAAGAISVFSEKVSSAK
jgi:hypothetical protein